MALVLQEKLPILEQALGLGIAGIERPSSSEAADFVLTVLQLIRDMMSWAVKGKNQKACNCGNTLPNC